MPVIGITGGIATGKTAFVAILRAQIPATFFDADQTARDLTQHDPEVRRLIGVAFGAEAFKPNGDLNRSFVRAIVFADAEKKRALEQILHPRIRRQWSLEAERRRHSTDLFLADIPLLYETAGEILCDRVVVVACSEEVQLERLMKRMPLSLPEAESMVAAQLPLAEKIRRADHVVWNNGGPPALQRQAVRLAHLWQKHS